MTVRSALYVFSAEQLDDAERLFVVGDVHGDLFHLEEFLGRIDIEENLVILLGDYSDRGENGLDVVERVSGLLSKYPQRIIGLKGNHEDYSLDGRPHFGPCHLIEEATERCGNWESYFFDTYKPFLERLYLAALIPGESLLVHGGVSREITGADLLAHPAPELATLVMHSDSTERWPGERFNEMRGKGIRFGADVTEAVCQNLALKRIIRGHQHDLAKNGPHFQHGGRLVTVISTNVVSRRPYVLAIDPKRPGVFEKVDLKTGRSTPVEV